MSRPDAEEEGTWASSLRGQGTVGAAQLRCRGLVREAGLTVLTSPGHSDVNSSLVDAGECFQGISAGLWCLQTRSPESSLE